MKNLRLIKKTIVLFFGVFCLLLCTSINLSAQSKVDQALKKLLDSEFMIKYVEMKEKAETTVKVFRNRQHNYSVTDVVKVEQAYNKTAKEFNKVLSVVKTDLLNRKKMKYIRNYPDSYCKSLELELYNLSDFYASNFQQVVNDVTKNEVDGSPFLMVLAEVLSLTKVLVSGIINISHNSKQFNEKYLNEKFVEPNSLPSWNEAGSDTPSNTNEQSKEESYKEKDPQNSSSNNDEEF